ncbi:MAG: type II toxin-antitoxin system PrlF family antitoxin [Betaproteobacteria bacterium]|nr:type II toxin-antitoxin system PrlF family antitoxin [Betaproteobacteria bacterium]
MPVIHELATLTSKGQVTLPKAIRQALGVGTGSRLAFDLCGDEVIVRRAETENEDPAIGVFLELLEADIRTGKHLHSLPEDLTQAMLAHAGQTEIFDEMIDGNLEF